MKAIHYSNVVNFPTPSRKIKNYNLHSADWQEKIRTNHNKKLSDTEIIVLWAIYRLALQQETTELSTTYEALKKFAKKSSKSSKQFKRYLDKIQTTNVIRYKSKKVPGNNAYELIISVDFGYLENLLYGHSGGHICPPHLSTTTPLKPPYICAIPGPLIEINKEITFLPKKERKVISKGASTVLKLNARAREEQNQNDFCVETEEVKPLELLPPIAAATTLGSQQQLLTQLSKPESPPTRADFLLPKLKNRIKSTFLADVALDLLSNLEFQLVLKTNKLRLIQLEGYQIPTEHHQALKNLIYEVYGPNTQITLRSLSNPTNGQQKVEALPTVEQEERFYNSEFKKPLWPIIRTRLVELYSEDLIRCWFDSLKCEEQPGTLIFRGRPVEIDYVATSRGNFISALTLLAMKHDIDFYFCNDLGKIIQVTDEGAFDVMQIGVPLSSLKGTGIDDICEEFTFEEENDME